MNKIALYFFSFLLLNSLLIQAQNTGQLTPTKQVSIVMMYETTNIPAFMKLDQSVAVDGFENWIKQKYNIESELNFKLINEEKDNLGFVHYKFQQTYKGYPLIDAIYIVHSYNNKIVSCNGLAFDKIEISNQISLSKDEALQTALNIVDAKSYVWEFQGMEDILKELMEDKNATYYPKGEVVLINPYKNFKSGKLRLAYKFNIFAKEPMSRSKYYIDASTGELLFKENIIHTANSKGTAHTKYSGTRTITTDSIAQDSFILRETGRGKGIETYDMNKSNNYGNAVDFVDTDNDWNNFNSNYDEIATDAHWGTEMTYDFYMNKFGRNSIDNKGLKLRSYVHYSQVPGQDYANAFWNGNFMTYGDGNASLSPLTALDITAHEITHGLTSYTAKLTYAYESGALNEGFSDVFGTTIEFYAKPTLANWLIGEDIGNAMRSMSNPKSHGQPDTYHGENYYFGSGDNGGVHKNNSIMNHWYYLLSVGGNGVNDNNDSFDVIGITIEKASKIAFRSLTVYMIPSTEFLDARTLTMQAATDLYGACSQEVESVIEAWYAVGVGTKGKIGKFYTPLTDTCTVPFTVKFTNLSDAFTSYSWDFGDGKTSNDKNPVHIYTTYGSFDVQLIASSVCSTDSITRKSYITIDSNILCPHFMSNTTTPITFTDCSGRLYDDGGTENYSCNLESVATIAPPNASSVTLNFVSFHYEGECDCDWIYIYDGASDASPLIGKYSGTQLPEGGTIRSTGPAITIKQSTDPMLTYSGFELTWQCSNPDMAPVSDFIIDKNESCKQAINFTDMSFNNPSSWLWKFGDGTASTLQNPSHIYDKKGIYSVKLIATNSNGSDSIIKNDLITITKPNVPFTKNGSNCGTGKVTLLSSGTGTLRWFENESTNNVLFEGDTFITPQITQTTEYYIEDVTGGIEHHTGIENKNLSSGGYYSNTNYHALVFNCFKDVKLKTVKVYADGDGNRTIQLKADDGTILDDTTMYINDGEQLITLNFDIPTATNLELGCQPVANFYRNNGGITYPIEIEGILSIHKTTATDQGFNGYYYFFYDWVIETSECSSNRTKITAYINSSPPDADFNFSINDSRVSFTNISSDAVNYIWDFNDGNYDSINTSPVHIYTTTGDYDVKLLAENGCGFDSTTKTINITSSIEDANIIDNLNIYPNPANNKLNISFETINSEDVSIQFINILGKTFITKKIKGKINNHKTEIDISNLPKGIYFIKIKNKEGAIIKKIIKK
ncbi:MAG: M4 family metallopeptidase [Bacteroidota bacterium]|nr:M4 family metallopeptidase [Bacteroidota bacterium]